MKTAYNRSENLYKYRLEQVVSALVVSGFLVCMLSDRALGLDRSPVANLDSAVTTGSENKSSKPEASPLQNVKIETKNSHVTTDESQEVLDTLKLIVKAFCNSDWKTIEDYTDDSCTTFDTSTNEILVGKQAVMDDLRRKAIADADLNGSPLLSFTIDQPYVQLNGDLAVVTFIATKEYGGKNPRKLRSNSTEIFIKKGDKWLKMHYNTDYQLVK